MTGLVDWALARARMVLAFIILSLAVGTFAYAVLPKEGEPDIEIPAIKEGQMLENQLFSTD